MGFIELNMPKYDEKDVSPSTLYTRQITTWCNSAFDEALWEQEQSDELKEVDKYIEYLSCNQWKSAGARASYKSRPVDNRMTPQFWELVGQLTDIRPIIEVRSSDTGQAGLKQGDVLNKGVKAWWLQNDVDMNLALCIIYAILTTGFAKWQFNPELNYGQGELEMVPYGPRSVMPLKATTNLDSGEACILKDVKPLAWMRRKFGARAEGIKPDERYSRFAIEQGPPSHIDPMIYRFMNEGLKRKISGESRLIDSVYPMAMYREFWLKDHTTNTSNVEVLMGRGPWSYRVPPQKLLYPRGRLIVIGGESTILEDTPNPYWHGLFPFTMLRLNVVPWQIYGMSDLRTQIPLQDIINNILAGVLDMIKKAVNPSFYAPKNAFSEQVWQSLDFSKPGERAAYSQNAAHEPKFAPAPQLPAYVLQMLTMVKTDLEHASGSAIAGEALKKKQVPGGDSLDQFRQMKETPVRLKGRNIEIFLRDGGRRQVPNMIQFWDAKKRMSVLGRSGNTFEDFDWDPGSMLPAGLKDNPQEHLSKFNFIVEPGSLLKLKRTELAMEIFRLRQMHDISRKTMYRLIEAPLDPEVEEAELKREAQSMPQPPPRKPKGMPAAAR